MNFRNISLNILMKINIFHAQNTFILSFVYVYHPLSRLNFFSQNFSVHTRRRFNVHVTSSQRYGRYIDVKTTLCAYTIQGKKKQAGIRNPT